MPQAVLTVMRGGGEAMVKVKVISTLTRSLFLGVLEAQLVAILGSHHRLGTVTSLENSK